MKNKGTQLAKKMVIALIAGLACGIGCIFLRENLTASGQVDTWNTINSILFQDITAQGAEKAIGLFYMVGQLFVNSLQLVIVPMVFTSIVLAIGTISDTRKLGRISTKTLGIFLFTTVTALVVAAIAGTIAFNMGVFNPVNADINISTGATGSNPLSIIMGIVPNNLINAFANNGGVLAIVFLAVAIGLSINALGDKVTVLTKLIQEANDIITVFLSFIINNLAPYAIFCLLTRTFAAYGINYLVPALGYVVVVTITLFAYLILAYAFYISFLGKLNPMPFLKKIVKVALFGFSTSSSAATLPLNKKVTTEELGVDDQIASFALPLGMTVNMDGTAIMQVIAALFIAVSSGYEVTFTSMAVIAVLALIASVGTPAAPGAGAVILFTILTGMGYVNDSALLAYSLILAINRPIEMLVTSLNVVGDSCTAVIVAKSEGVLNEDVYNG